MVDYRPQAKATLSTDHTRPHVDQGLRSHMLRVYNYMFLGLAITGAVAFSFMNLISDGTGLNQLGLTLFASPLKYVILFAPLAMVFFLSFRITKLSSQAAQLCFWIYATLVGVSFSTLGLVYSGNNIASAFLVTSITFGSMS